MDIVYSIGPNDGTDWFNLRMSLRSVSKYARNLGKVVVVGYVPGWLTDDVVKVEKERIWSLGKQWNILESVFEAIDCKVVEGEFLYSSDDHFLVKETDLDNFPYYCKGGELPTREELMRKGAEAVFDSYSKSLAGTRELLEENGYGVLRYHGHVNTHWDTRDADEVRRMVYSKKKRKIGYEPTCLFANVADKRRKIVPTERKDCKIGDFSDEDAVWKEIGDRETFSVTDDADKGSKEAQYCVFMGQLYDIKSRYEK